MNNYNQMYHKCSFMLRALAENNEAFGEPFNIDELSKKEENLLIAILRKTLNISDGTDGDEGAATLGLTELLDSSFADKHELIDALNNYVIPSCQGKTRKFFVKLVYLLQRFIDENEDKETEDVLQKVMSTSLTFPYNSDDDNYEVVRHLFMLRQFAFNKQNNPSLFPTCAPSIDTSKFDGLSRYELAQMFSKENFFSLSKNEAKALLQATVNNYLAENNVEPCAVVFEDLPLTPNSVTFGEYDPNRGVIALNSKVFDIFAKAGDCQNQNFAYHLLSTAIHEARHRVQFSKFDSQELSARENAVVKSLRSPFSSSSFADYLSAPEELDAREAALEYLQDCSKTLNNPSMAAYYNQTLKQEIGNQKASVPEDTKQLFNNIYSGEKLDSSINLRNDLASFKRLLRQAAPEPTL